MTGRIMRPRCATHSMTPVLEAGDKCAMIPTPREGTLKATSVCSGEKVASNKDPVVLFVRHLADPDPIARPSHKIPTRYMVDVWPTSATLAQQQPVIEPAISSISDKTATQLAPCHVLSPLWNFPPNQSHPTLPVTSQPCGQAYPCGQFVHGWTPARRLLWAVNAREKTWTALPDNDTRDPKHSTHSTSYCLPCVSWKTPSSCLQLLGGGYQ